jgi:DNA polymerase-3 subunit epsilon
MTNHISGFDVETSGLNPNEDEIIQAYWGNYTPSGELLEGFEWIIKPSKPISQESIDIHGFTNEYLEEHGQDRGSAITEIYEVITRGGYSAIIGQNIVFDFTFLREEFQRAGLSPIDFRDLPVYDTLVIDKHNNRYRKGNRKLITLAGHYGVTLDPERLHKADYDVEVTVNVALKQMNVAEVKDWRRAVSDQEAWAREQQLSLQSYFDRSGRTEEDGSRIVVKTGWPVYD